MSNQLSHWINGSLNNQDSYTIAAEVTFTLGILAFMVTGARGTLQGGRGMLQTLRDPLPIPQGANAMATAGVTLNTQAITASASQAAQGLVFMSNPGGPRTAPEHTETYEHNAYPGRQTHTFRGEAYRGIADLLRHLRELCSQNPGTKNNQHLNLLSQTRLLACAIGSEMSSINVSKSALLLRDCQEGQK